MSKPELNRKLLKEVRDHILANPENLEMRTWAVQKDCGTIGCIGGWTNLLCAGRTEQVWQVWRKFSHHSAADAQQSLGLTDQEAHIMFFHFKKTAGEAGACEVACKIDTILEDRDEFVRKFGGIYCLDDHDSIDCPENEFSGW